MRPGMVCATLVLRCRRWSCWATGLPRCLADGSGVPLTLRRAEILALPDSRSQGWSAEELAYELHGDAGTPHGDFPGAVDAR